MPSARASATSFARATACSSPPPTAVPPAASCGSPTARGPAPTWSRTSTPPARRASVTRWPLAAASCSGRWDNAIDYEVWFSDGTDAGTFQVCDLDPNGGSAPEFLTLCAGRILFLATEPSVGKELFQIATPGASVELLGQSGSPDHPALATGNGRAPVLGGSFDLVGTGPAGHFGVLLAGGPGLPVPPPPNPGLIQGGCDWVGMQAGTATTQASVAAPSFTLTINVPSDPLLEGVPFRFQTAWLRPGATPLLQVSNAVQVVPGTSLPH